MKYRNERENIFFVWVISYEIEEENYKLFFGSLNEKGFDKMLGFFDEVNKIKKLKKRLRIIRGLVIIWKIYFLEWGN